ncbi:uncharacterized protein LOC101899194 [Musca domestica]|uniref:Uncharacterized protein LOC101899194 n=1 Tax=Musca domestica TaxID=7370 RepID=A0A1I8M3E8_MUSDO|nr:uncharacterized protein LOC101899194 [Musca domestica]
MNHLKWMGHSATILEIHKGLRDDLQSCEVTMVAGNSSVKAHRFVLSSCSDLLRNLLSDVPLQQECCIMLPDISGYLLENVLSFVYLGECSLSSTNLSEFLEAINVLGIKSAISFECHTNAMQVSQSQNINNNAITSNAPANVGVGRHVSASAAVHGPGTTVTIQHQEELIEAHAVLQTSNQTTLAPNTNTASTNEENRDLEFIDVYQHEPQHKITYSIEHVPGSTNGNEFILTENSGTFTLTQNHKLDSTSSSESTTMEVNEEDACESHIIEEYSSGDEPLIHIGSTDVASVTTTNVSTATQTNNPTPSTINTTSIIEMKPKSSMKTLKLRGHTAAAGIIPKLDQVTQNEIEAVVQTTDDEAMSSMLHSSADSSYALLKDTSANESIGSDNSKNDSTYDVNNAPSLTATDLAYQAMVNEGMSLPKAAGKFNVSKTELWRRVRSTGVESLQKVSKIYNDKMDVIELASQAVINEGLSLQKAAIRYDISKTVLWRRVRKHPQYMKTTRENPIISKAYERLKTGESLKSISQDLDIPMSTLHRHKVRLSNSGQLPDFVSCRKRDSVSKDDLKVKLAKAVYACIHEGMSQNHAANLYEISKSTLWRHLQRRVAEAEGAETSEGAIDTDENIKKEVVLS